MNLVRRFFGHLLGAVGVIGVALFFLVFSCSQKTPTAPVASQAPNPAAGQVSTGPLASLPVVDDFSENTVGKLVGWLGGVLAIPVENTTKTSLLSIPSGNLLQSVFITAGARYDDGQKAVFYDFGPDGLTFLKPALLTHRALQPNGTVLYLWYFNPTSKQWEKAGSATVVAGSASFSILHFSQWAVSEDGDGFGSGGQQ